MLDPIAQGLRAVSSGSAYAFPLVFAAGAISSIGPCVAPRFIAITGVVANHTRGRSISLTCSFVGGLVAAYASFGTLASIVGRVAQFSTWVYAVVAIVLGVTGAIALWKGEPGYHNHAGISSVSRGGATFFLGASFAMVISPCCTPVVLAILAYTSTAGSTIYGTALLACFAVGHSLPLLAAAAGARGVGVLLERCAVREAAVVLSSALMLALAGYYAVLA